MWRAYVAWRNQYPEVPLTVAQGERGSGQFNRVHGQGGRTLAGQHRAGRGQLEDARMQAGYGQHSFVGKILEIRQELPGRIHIVLVHEPVGF